MEELASAGNSLVLVAVNGQLELALGLKDEIRAGVKEDLAALKKLGVKNLLLLSGDNQKMVDLVAEELGLTEAYGQLLPEDKAEFVKKRQAAGEIVAFVGDGINDSPSLARADIGIAMGSGTDVAIETSNVVLMNGSFDRIPRALALAKATRRVSQLMDEHGHRDVCPRRQHPGCNLKRHAPSGLPVKITKIAKVDRKQFFSSSRPVF